MIIQNKNNLTMFLKRNVINCYKLLSTIIFLFLILLFIPFANTKDKQTQESYLILKPKICVKNSELCQSIIEAEWKYTKAVSVCLYSNVLVSSKENLKKVDPSKKEEKIECWDNTNSGKTEFEVNTETDLQITLQLDPEKKILLKANLSVMDKGIRVKHLRKKRILWSDF